MAWDRSPQLEQTQSCPCNAQLCFPLMLFGHPSAGGGGTISSPMSFLSSCSSLLKHHNPCTAVVVRLEPSSLPVSFFPPHVPYEHSGEFAWVSGPEIDNDDGVSVHG